MTDWNWLPSALLMLLLALLLISLVTLVALYRQTQTSRTLKSQSSNQLTQLIHLSSQLSRIELSLQSTSSLTQSLMTNHLASQEQLTKIIDKQTALLASKGPLEYQAVQLMNQQNLEVVSEDYDPSDAAEILRMKERGSLNDVYGNDWSGIDEPQFSITDQENLGAGAPYIA